MRTLVHVEVGEAVVHLNEMEEGLQGLVPPGSDAVAGGEGGSEGGGEADGEGSGEGVGYGRSDGEGGEAGVRVSEVRVERAQMLISVRADALFSLDGTMGRLAAFDLRGDHLAREHALAQPPSSPPMVCPREECDGAPQPQPQPPGAHLVSFGYRRFSNPPLPSAASCSCRPLRRR